MRGLLKVFGDRDRYRRVVRLHAVPGRPGVDRDRVRGHPADHVHPPAPPGRALTMIFVGALLLGPWLVRVRRAPAGRARAPNRGPASGCSSSSVGIALAYGRAPAGDAPGAGASARAAAGSRSRISRIACARTAARSAAGRAASPAAWPRSLRPGCPACSASASWAMARATVSFTVGAEPPTAPLRYSARAWRPDVAPQPPPPAYPRSPPRARAPSATARRAAAPARASCDGLHAHRARESRARRRHSGGRARDGSAP